MWRSLSGRTPGLAARHARGRGSAEEPRALGRGASRLAKPQEVAGASRAGAGYTQAAGAKVQAMSGEGVTSTSRGGVVVGTGQDR